MKTPMRAGDAHPRYDLCRDRSCERYGCVAYREGHADGYQDGYDDGFPDGVAACPRPHAKE